MATLDAFDVNQNVLSPAKDVPPVWMSYSTREDSYRVSIPELTKAIDEEPYSHQVVRLLMAYPDALAPLLSVDDLLKIYRRCHLQYPNYLTSLPYERRNAIMHTLYRDALKRTAASKRHEDPTVNEVLDKMDVVSKEAFFMLLPKADTIEARVMLWLMT